ncbi:MAG: dTDP-4-dehydrorhamnose 3,5-epimerase family protein [Sulfobacillus sp.]
MIEAHETRLGCMELRPVIHTDERGLFVKPYAKSAFDSLGLCTSWCECFYSRSVRGVIRGLHLQEPPAAQAKLVLCVAGKVFDVVVDLRAGSPTFGEYESFTLDAQRWNAVYIPVGFAHGFATVSEYATVAYIVSSEHDPNRDAGVHWDSLSIPWPVDDPVVSERDDNLPPWADYVTPFNYQGSAV